MPYHLIHSGWMVSGFRVDHRPHNPLVAGSSPACPTFSTHTSEKVFEHFARNAKTAFYANFTHSTGIDWHNSAHLLAFALSFHEKVTDLFVFYWEHRELREQSTLHFYFQRLTYIFRVPYHIISLRERREHPLFSISNNSLIFFQKKYQNNIQVRIICVIFAFRTLISDCRAIFSSIFGGMRIRCAGYSPSTLVYKNSSWRRLRGIN